MPMLEALARYTSAMRPVRLLAYGLMLAALTVSGCAYENNEEDVNDDILTVRMIFNERVRPERFFYYLIFNFSEDATHRPRTDHDVFQDRDVLGEFWDVYYVYGQLGDPNAPLEANFYKGFAGNDPTLAAHPLRRDTTGELFADKLPNRPFDSTDLEFLSATITNDSTSATNPNQVLTGNTIEYRFRVSDFPNAPFPLLADGSREPTAKAKIAMIVTNQGIDNVSNPDDNIDNVIIYDRFREGYVEINVAQQPKWGEDIDPQEDIEEDRPPRNPNLESSALFRAADLKNWKIELVQR